MTTPPPTLPPLRSLGIDLPPPPSAALSSSSRRNNHNLHVLLSDPIRPTAASDFDLFMPPVARAATVQPTTDAQTHDDDRNSLMADEHDDEDDDGENDDQSDDDIEDGEMDPYPWRAIKEDTSVPCADEIAWIESLDQHSANDHTYWQEKTFFDLNDPDLKPGAYGRIDWIVTNFNGTKDKPNKQLLMKSPLVNIGGYDWQIKFYPKGNRSEFLSVYIECVSMTKDDFNESVDFKHPPLPVLVGSPRLKRRVSVAAQVSVVMYNPEEPQVHEFKSDAHQYHKQNADFGWRYFTVEPRDVFHQRRHGQRAAILRNDTLAFTAYIRLIDDPTGCIWDAQTPCTDIPRPPTSLVRFEGVSARPAAFSMLFHLLPFRKWLYTTKSVSSRVLALQTALDRFLGRRLRRKHLRNHSLPSGCDVVAILHAIRAGLVKDDSAQTVAEFDEVLGCLNASETPVAHNRLRTSNETDILSALKKRPGQIAHPIMFFELERQRFNNTTRKWTKVMNPVLLNDKVEWAGFRYQLYSFITHAGPHGSTNFATYVRPGGSTSLWYEYSGYGVKALTNKAAMQKTCSSNDAASDQTKHIAYLAVYIRSDLCASAFAAPAEEIWHMTDTLSKAISRPIERRDARVDGPRAPPEVKQALTAAVNVPGAFIPAHHDFIDEDVIMSDVEDNIQPASYLISAIQNSTNNGLDNQLIDYYCGEYYQGGLLPNGKYHGYGHLISSNGDEYRGGFTNGKPDGDGTMIYSLTGNKYEGRWARGQQHGHGKLFEKDTGNEFEGGWKEGRKHGAFILKGRITDDDKQSCQICYERDMNIAFSPCGHVVSCKGCATELTQCPICRTVIRERLELFGVKLSMS